MKNEKRGYKKQIEDLQNYISGQQTRLSSMHSQKNQLETDATSSLLCLQKALSFRTNSKYRWYQDDQKYDELVGKINDNDNNHIHIAFAGNNNMKRDIQKKHISVIPQSANNIIEMCKIVTQLRKITEVLLSRLDVDDEKWDANCKGNITISGQTIENSGGSWQSVFGTKICGAPYIYKWTLQIVDVSKNSGNSWKIIIGIIEKGTGQEVKSNYFTSQAGKGYGFIGSQAGITVGGGKDDTYGQKFEKEGDKIEVCLDMKNLTLSYAINGTQYGVAHDVNNREYRLAVSIYPGRKIELLSYSSTNK
eukprot:286600_1